MTSGTNIKHSAPGNLPGNNNHEDNRPFVKRLSFIISLAAVTAITATAIDIALPGHPAIGASFGTTGEAAGVIVSTYFLGYGPGQMLWGPLADKYGRMKPLYFGIIGFIITSILCAMATSLESLAFYRLIQGIFGGCGPVIVRAIARDQGGGKETANLMATIMMIFGAAPLLAPLVGSGILYVMEWRFIFWFLVAFGLSLLVLSYIYLAPATRHHSMAAPKRTPFSLALCKRILTERDFVMGAVVMAVIFFGYSAMLGVGAAMTMETYGISPQTFGVLFAIAASAVMMGPAISRKIIGTRSLRLPLKLGGGLAFLVGLAFVVFTVVDKVSLWVLWPMVFFYVLAFGIMMPIASAIALEEAGDAAGTASSLLSTIPTLAAAAGAWIAAMVDGPDGAGLFRDGYQSLTMMMAFGGLGAGGVALMFGGGRKSA
jgi:DHA1 family bicyclomycin/chloramphenicol resistance-like MFS transporter